MMSYDAYWVFNVLPEQLGLESYPDHSGWWISSRLRFTLDPRIHGLYVKEYGGLYDDVTHTTNMKFVYARLKL